MFCPKCGSQIPDGSAFCSVCGTRFGAPQARPAAARPASTKPAFQFATFNLGLTIKLAIALLTFMFGFLPWISSRFGGSTSIFNGNIFDVNAALGVAMILMILGILVFFALITTYILKINSPFNFQVLASALYYGIFSLCLLLNLIGSLVEDLSPAVFWYFALMTCIGGFVMTFIKLPSKN